MPSCNILDFHENSVHVVGVAKATPDLNAGPNIEVDKVIAIECGRGVCTVSGSQGITIQEVEIARVMLIVQNLRISGSPWGIRQTLPRSNHNRILKNDLRGNRNCLEYPGEGTVAEGDVCYRGGRSALRWARLRNRGRSSRWGNLSSECISPSAPTRLRL